jgi:6-phosphogluconolactonase
MITESFLDRLGWARPVVHEMPGETCDAQSHEGELRQIIGPEPHLDLAVLGLGADGHTASLFPGDPVLEIRDRWVAEVERPDHARLTLTLPVLSSARVAMFLVSGEDKREALRRLLDAEDIPATRVKAGRIVVVADPAAAG